MSDPLQCTRLQRVIDGVAPRVLVGHHGHRHRASTVAVDARGLGV